MTRIATLLAATAAALCFGTTPASAGECGYKYEGYFPADFRCDGCYGVWLRVGGCVPVLDSAIVEIDRP